MVLHRSAEFGEHPASLCAVKYRNLCRFVLAVVRHISISDSNEEQDLENL